ncbi:MAG TPA: cytochrome c oxidase assembly protein [Thermoleophilaceae bacterium]|nr:cytochrome c oxidase assembly protein [Thermoleophilaceae bacterium]
MSFSLDPGVLAFLAVGVALYVRAVGVAHGRGLEVTRFQQAAFYGGVALWAIALVSPLDRLAEDLLSAHMAQHLLLAELGGPLILAGLRAPVIFFYLPPAALKALARRRRLRRVMGRLTTPLGAIATYALVLYGWHFAPAFEAALHHPLVHAIQHQSFFFIAILVWIPALEPTRRRLRGELWKAGHILGARLVGMFLGMAFIAMRSPAYDWYVGRTAEHGLKPLTDQQIAGGLMLSLDVAIMLFAVAFFFFRSGEDHDRAEAEAYGSTSPRRMA